MRNLLKKLTFRFSEKIIALMFLAFCFYLGLSAFQPFLENCGKALENGSTLAEFIEVIDDQYSSMLTTKTDQPLLYNKATYINMNGQIAKLLDQQIVNERMKLTNGHLAGIGGTYDPQRVQVISENLYEFYEAQAEKGKNFLFVLAPTQYYGHAEYLPTGYTDYANLNGDLLTQLLEDKGVPVLDLREKMREQSITYTDAFFVTDHHWKPQTAFWAYTELMTKLWELGFIDELAPELIDSENYRFEVYEKCYLGSSGRRTGQYFAGVDDFCLIVPKFDTEISVTVSSRNVEKNGRYEDVSHSKSYEEFVQLLENPDYFNTDPYAAYGYGNTAMTNWRNENAPADQRFLLIGDSMANIPFSLLPLGISSCDELDMRSYSDDFTSYYNEYDPDTVIIFVNVGGILSKDAYNVTYDFIP